MAGVGVVRRSVGVGFQVVGVLVVAALAVGLWFAWLGWDRSYRYDPVTETLSGPYDAWQVIGCGVTLAALLVGALLLGVRPVPACAALTLAFTTAWTINAASMDDSGLYPIGAFLLFIGLGSGTALFSALTLDQRRKWLARRRS